MTKIAWTDATWNPVTGCTPISPGCANCYAAAMVPRLQTMNPKTAEKYRNGFNVTLHPDELKKPLAWKKPKMIFVCSMGDLFHEKVPFHFIDKVMNVIDLTPQHTYQILTKRPGRMRLFFFNRYWELGNMWLGVTVCNQEEADRNIPALLDIDIPADGCRRFVSIEPMLTAINISQYLPGYASDWVDWIIVGGETGANARPMDADWARTIRDQCRYSKTPFFFKQMSGRQPMPEDLNIKEFPTKGGTR
ncbi:MAG: phage Gp37/Gp68 family protein [Planctomycetaceae bacterium]|nr:phage Gp37/Gp68 family protein [Planctomycetaceae bacterium]